MDHNKGMTTNLDEKHLRHVQVHCMKENQCLFLSSSPQYRTQLTTPNNYSTQRNLPSYKKHSVLVCPVPTVHTVPVTGIQAWLKE
jgi:hypothetical protein